MQPYRDDHSEISVNDSIKSAREIVPFIVELVKPNSVIDVGCGLGAWLSIFAENGVEEVLGIDGDYVDIERLKIPMSSFLTRDLKQPFTLEQVFDLVLSLEVGEHLPSESANLFVDSLVKLGPAILFSAALPYQPGDFHINCQWPEYWANLFYQRGYVLFDCLRMKFWNNRNVSWWYSQNTLLFIKQSCLSSYPILNEHFHFTTSAPISVVHPDLYQLQQVIYGSLEAPSSIKSSLLRQVRSVFKGGKKNY